MEVEYHALVTITCELQWMTYFLQDLHVQTSATSTLYCDNQSTCHIAHNPTFYERTKHIDMDCQVAVTSFKLIFFISSLYVHIINSQMSSPRLFIVLSLEYYFQAWIKNYT